MRILAVLLLAGLVGPALAEEAAPLAGPAAAATWDCAVPPQVLEGVQPMPAVAERLRQGQRLDIVVLGSASSAGHGVGGSANAYPAVLQQVLAERRPGDAVAVTNQSERALTAADMLVRLEKSVVPRKPTLVIWQTGSVDASHGVDLGGYGTALASGLDLLRSHGIDVLLVEPQYAPQAEGLVDFDPYRDDARRIAESRDITVFRRWDVMKAYVEAGYFDPAQTRRAAQVAAARRLHQCLARLMAGVILDGARLAEGQP